MIMEYISAIIFLLASIVLLNNIQNLLSVFTNSSYTMRCSVFCLIYLISAPLYVIFRFYFSNPILVSFILIVYYMSLILNIYINSKYKFIEIVYFLLLYLSVDSIIQAFIKFIISLSTDMYAEHFIRIFSMLVSSLILFFLTRIIKSKKIIVNTSLIPNYIYVLILISLFFGGGLIESQLTVSNIKVQSNMGRAFTVITVLMLMLIIISLVSNCISKAYFKNISSILEKQVNDQVNYYNKIDKLNDELRNFRHDYKNHLLCVQGLLDGNEYDEAREYIHEITQQRVISSKKFNSGNTIADAILSDKSEQAEKIGAKIKYHGTIFENISPADLCTILSNALDNAIEACEKVPEDRSKIISVNCSYIKNIQFICIRNSVAEDVKIFNNCVETSKSDKSLHGIGLYNIRNTVAKYEGEFNISCNDKQFVLDIGFKINLKT